jgi:glycosyltransferase involved in cell wall biosynthesis
VWAEKHDVTIVKTSYTSNHDYILNAKVKIVDLCSEERMPRLAVIKSLRKIFINEKPSVVVSFIDTGSFYVSIALRGLKIVHVCSERNNPVFYPHNRIIRFMRWFAFRRCDAIVFQTEGARNFFEKKIREKGVIIANPIDNKANTQRVTLSQINPIIVSFGRLVLQKNFSMLIESFASFLKNHPQYKLHIYGRGKLHNQLETKIHSLGLNDNVKLCGFADNVSEILSGSKIFVLSSLHEGLPNALLEALSAGVPSISTDCPPGGPKLLLSGCQGSLLIENNSAVSLANALSTIVSNYSHYYIQALEDSKMINEKYSITNVAAEWITLFERLSYR